MTKIKLNGITWDHSRGYDPLVAASKFYMEDTPVEISWEKRGLKDFGDQSLEDLADSFDLLIIDHPHVGVASASKCVLALDKFVPVSEFDLLRKQAAGPSFDSYHYSGHQWALPIDAAMQTAVYRPDLLKQSIPENWEAVLKMDHLGMALCPTDSLCSFLSIAAQLGAPVSAENSTLIPEKKGMEVLELLKLINGKSHPGSINWNPIQLFDYMAENNDVVYAPLVFCYTNYSRKDYRKKRLSFTNPPNVKNALLGGAGIAVSAKCNYPEAAVLFSTWICSEQVQKGIYTINEGQPGNIKAWEDGKANDVCNGFFKSTLASLENAYVRPRFENWPKFQEYLGDMVHECIKENRDNLKTIKHLNQEFEIIKS